MRRSSQHGLTAIALLCAPHLVAAQSDTARKIAPVTVTGTRPVGPATTPPPVLDGVILAGKTAALVRVDSTGTNTARDVSRELYGRIPGANVSELGGGGFPSNGIGFRGLNPTQSVEVNIRQNGVNIAGDLYGYNETYYSPPSDLIEDVLVVRGASSLAYGPQFGGAINYLLKHGTPNSAPAIEVSQSVGSFGLFDTFGSVGGGVGPLTYYAALQHRAEEGERPNSDYNQTDAYARVDLQASPATSVGLEYTRFRNRIHMPGGLTDAEFDADPEQSERSRNWLSTPWNILEAHVDSRPSDHAHLYVTSSLMAAQRYLVWLSEDGGPQLTDSINPATGAYAPREVNRETFLNGTLEARLEVLHSLFGTANTLTVGLRGFDGTMHRQSGGVGSTGTDFNMNLDGPYALDVTFGTQNVALFAENMIHVTDRWSITPGGRVEYLRSAISGYTGDSTTVPSQAKNRVIALGGIGTEYFVAPQATVYADLSQAYRPITYDLLTPFANASRISPDLKDGSGFDLDVGWRGTLRPGLSGSVTGFYLVYDHREGTFSGIDTTESSTFTELATIGNSVARGVETSVTLSPFVVLGLHGPHGILDGLSLFDIASYDDAHYTSGAYHGNAVEEAPRWIHRAGATYAYGPATTTVQVSTQTHSYTDANNTTLSPDDADIGVIPGYTVVDWSAALRVATHFDITVAINNIADAHYFTNRSTEYPGPGILPSPGRSLTVGVRYQTH
jgi:Fe(3+) dicitrate transport protein